MTVIYIGFTTLLYFCIKELFQTKQIWINLVNFPNCPLNNLFNFEQSQVEGIILKLHTQWSVTVNLVTESF